jgi:hypothetical protein
MSPFTRRLAELLSLVTHLRRRKKPKKSYAHDLDGGLSVTCAGLAGERTLALLFSSGILVVAKSSDACWAVVDRRPRFVVSLSFVGRFYCTADGANMAVCITKDRSSQLEEVAVLATPFTFTRIVIGMGTMHLVDNDGEMVLMHSRLY